MLIQSRRTIRCTNNNSSKYS